MSENKEYDYVVGKLPRKDKDGKDATHDKLGRGGRHRDDGTFSAMAYDLQIVEDDPTKPAEPSLHPDFFSSKERNPVRYEDLSIGEQIVVDMIERIARDLTDYAARKITEGIENWFKNRRQKKEQERLAQKKVVVQATTTNVKKTSHDTQVVSNPIIQNKNVSRVNVIIPDEFRRSFEQYSSNMTSEEAQKELLDAFVLYIISAKKIWKVANANVTDSNGEQISGSDMLDRISNSTIIESINSIITNNPALLEEWQSLVLKELLGRDIIIEGKFTPLEKSDFKKVITDQQCREKLGKSCDELLEEAKAEIE